MAVQWRVDIALQYRAVSYRLLADEEHAAAGEMLWGAIHNVLQAIAIQHVLLDDPNSAIKDNYVVQHLMDEHGHDISLRRGFNSARRLHGHFYNHNLPASTHHELLRATSGYIDTLMGIAKTDQSS